METPIIYAGLWKRFVAWFADAAILSMLLFLVMSNLRNLIASDSTTFSGLDFSVRLIAIWLYFALFESSARQATIGKKAVGIKVTSLSGERLDFWSASLRWLTKIFSLLLMGLPFLMIAVTQRQQGLHDMIAGSLVIQTADDSPETGQTAKPDQGR